MAFALLYVDNASVLATFNGHDEASDALTRFAAKHPEVRDNVAILELDEQGRGTGEYEFSEAHSALFA